MTTTLPETGNLAALSGPVAAASFVAGVAGATALSDAPFPRPGSSRDQIRRYFSDNANAAKVSIVGQLVSVAALGGFAAAVAKLAGREDNAGAIRAAAIVGGALSVVTLTASALTSLRLAEGEADDPNSALRLYKRVFVTGGPLHGPAIGLLMLALGLAGGLHRGTSPIVVTGRAGYRSRWVAGAHISQGRARSVVDSGEPFPGTSD
jgi:hypothetical protein